MVRRDAAQNLTKRFEFFAPPFLSGDKIWQIHGPKPWTEIRANAIEPSDLLGSFYDAGDGEAAPLLDHILQAEVRPLLSKVVRWKLTRFLTVPSDREADIEDLVQDGVLRVAQELLAGRRGGNRIVALSNYTARVAEHAGDDYFRRKFRKRYNALKRVTVNLRNHDAFYEWMFCEVSHGALSTWPPPPTTAPESRANAIRTNLHATTTDILGSIPGSGGDGSPNSVNCMHASLVWASGALTVSDLALVLQSARNEFDKPDLELKPDIAIAPVTHSEADAAKFLSSIWDAIKQLRPGSAKALLLNLRVKDGDAVELFEDFKIATREEIAELLGLQPNELTQLPWPDRRIAECVGCAEEQIAGLRSSARRSIGHRISSSKHFPEECLKFRL